MRSTRKVRNTRVGARLRELHGAVLDIVSAINRPQRDEALIREAGIPLDRALFPLLVSVGRFGPIGIVQLADRVGRNYTTVSRQIARLESLGLVERQGNAADGRIREAIVSRKGKAMTRRVDAARDRMGRAVFATWDAGEIDELTRLMRRFAAALNDDARPAAAKPGKKSGRRALTESRADQEQTTQLSRATARRLLQPLVPSTRSRSIRP